MHGLYIRFRKMSCSTCVRWVETTECLIKRRSCRTEKGRVRVESLDVDGRFAHSFGAIGIA